MVPAEVRTLFWDTNLSVLDPACHPDYAIFRVLEFGDDGAVNWLRKTFSSDEIRRVLRTERRLSKKSATFWALIYRVPDHEVAALMPQA